MVELDEKQKKKFGERVRSIRIELGVNQEKFGEYFKKNDDPNDKEGIANKAVVSAWERGVSVPTIDRLKIIAELGNMTVNELLYGYKDEIMSFDTGEEFHEFRNLIIKTINAREVSNGTKSFINNKITLIDLLKKDIESMELEIEKNNYLLSKGELSPEEVFSINGSLGAAIHHFEEKIKELESNPKYKFYIYNNVIYVLVNKKDLTVSDINFDVSQYDNLIIEIDNKEVDKLHNLTKEKLINVIHLNHDWNTNIKLTYDAWFKVTDNPQSI